MEINVYCVRVYFGKLRVREESAYSHFIIYRMPHSTIVDHISLSDKSYSANMRAHFNP